MFKNKWLKHALAFAALQWSGLVQGNQEIVTEGVEEEVKERGPPIAPTAIFLD